MGYKKKYWNNGKKNTNDRISRKQEFTTSATAINSIGNDRNSRKINEGGWTC